MEGLRFSVLGSLDVRGPDGPVVLGGPRQRAVLGLLLMHAGDVVSTELLVDGLWGDDPPPTAERTLHAYIARLRSILEPHAGPAAGLLGRAAHGYRLTIAPDQLDALAFEDALLGARRELAAGETEAAAVRLRRALGMWRGRAFSDLLEFPGIAPAATRLEHLRADAQVDTVEAELSLGRHEQVAPHIEELLAQRPLDERLWAALATAYYRSGLQGDALETIAKARRVLVDQLGIEPGLQLRDLQAAVLAGDPRLDAPSRGRAAVALDHSGLEGRAEPLERFRQAWKRASSGAGGTLIVAGPVGIGRSRLLRAFAVEARAAGGHVVHISSTGGNAPGEPASGDAAFVASAVAASGGATLLVTVDDADRGGAAAARAWAGIAEAAAEQPALLVLAVRDDRVDADLSAMLARIDPTGDQTLRLRPLAPEEVARVASGYVGQQLALEAGLSVFSSAAGNPALVHREVETWAKQRLRDVVSRSARTAADDWSGAQRGQAELIGGLMDLVAVDVAAAAARAVAGPATDCPYPGLAPFEAQRAAFFAGREELVAAATARLLVAGSLVVTGPSGAGKSSLVRAGVVPAIRAGTLPGSERWRIDVVTPGSLGELTGANGEERLVVLDQMEELLGYDEAERSLLVTSVGSLMREGTRLVFITRSDLYAQLTDDPVVTQLLDVPQLHVGPMSHRQLMRAVEVPVQRAGGSCEDELAATIATDLASEPGALALLSTTMTQLWDRCPGGRLTLQAYTDVGGVREAVARLAEETYNRLTGPERAATKVLLLRMAASDDAGQVVRSFVSVASLPESPDAHTALLALVEDRLVVVDDGRATVAHEALFFAWPRLARWISEDAEARTARARLSAAVRAWAEGGRQPTDLARGRRLAAASDLARQHPEMLSEDEGTFVRASEELAGTHERELVGRAEAQRRTNRRLRRMFAVTAVLLVITLVAAAVDLHLRHRADAAATVATARELGAQAVTTGRLDVAMLLAAQAAQIDPGQQSVGALIAVMSRAPRAIRVLVGSGQRILSVAVGGSGPRAVAMDRGGVATVFDVSTGTRLSLPPDVGDVNGAAFSPDGRNLVLGGGDPLHPGGHLFFLDARTLRLDGPTVDTASAVDAVTYTGDGRRLGVLTDDGAAHMLDVGSSAFTGAPLATGVRHPSAISFDRSSQWMLTLGTSEVRSVGSPDPLPLPVGYPGALSPDGSTVAIASANQIQLVSRATGEVTRVLAGHTAPVEALSYSADGKLLASVADDGLAIVWDIATGARVADLTGHAGRVNAVAFSPDDRTLVTGGFDGRLVVWNLSAPSSFGTRVGSLAGIQGASGLADGYAAMSAATDRVLVGEPAGTVVIARTDGQAVGSFPGAHHGDVYDAELSRDGRLGATVGSDSTIRVWDVVAGRPYQPVPVIQTGGSPASVAISADHRLVAWGDVTGTLTMASLADGHVLWRHQLGSGAAAGTGTITLLAFSPDDSTVAANVLHVATELVAADGSGSPQVLHAADNNTWAFAFSADGSRLVTGDADGSAQLWNMRTGTTTDLGPTEAAANAGISGAAFDPSGNSFATWALDGSLQVWDPRTGQAIGPPVTDPQDGAVMAASWQNAAELTTLHSSGAELRLPLNEAGLLDRACALAGRELSTQEWVHYLPGRPYKPACAR